MENINFGYVYVLQNPTFKQGVYKIGYTERTVKERIEELNSTGIPTGYKEVCSFYVPYVREGEKIVHEELKDKRMSRDREFFLCTKDEINYAMSLLDTLYYRLFERIASSLENIIQINCNIDDVCVLQKYDKDFSYSNYEFDNIINNGKFGVKGDEVYAYIGEMHLGSVERIKEYLKSLAKVKCV